MKDFSMFLPFDASRYASYSARMVGFMAKIDIEIPHPLAALVVIGSVVGAVVWMDYATGGEALAFAAWGGSAPQEKVHEAEKEGQRLRTQQAILQRREEILRYQLRVLQNERRLRGYDADTEFLADVERAEQMLLDLLRDQEEAEAKILLTLRQIWDAESRAAAISKRAGRGEVRIRWPIDPQLGISAVFDDPRYEEMFGMPHKAIDIPAPQGSIARAAADGVVEEVNDNGYGYNSLILRHHGFATVYGHVSAFRVHAGQTVRAGDPIAETGGRPGERGSGIRTTGPHLHFEIVVDGERVDPLLYLPKER
jgi:murein DD-endopeptidase MepM/ murein hydrolase activator NlpD